MLNNSRVSVQSFKMTKDLKRIEVKIKPEGSTIERFFAVDINRVNAGH